MRFETRFKPLPWLPQNWKTFNKTSNSISKQNIGLISHLLAIFYKKTYRKVKQFFQHEAMEEVIFNNIFAQEILHWDMLVGYVQLQDKVVATFIFLAMKRFSSLFAENDDILLFCFR